MSTVAEWKPDSNPTGPLVELVGVGKRYDQRDAVKNLTFSVMPGTILGLLGPNGAGKTSTLRMIVNILEPDTGTIKIAGHRAGEDTKRLLGYIPEERGLYKKMTLKGLLALFGRLHGLDKSTSEKRAIAWLERLELGHRANDRVETLSKGMQQKVQFACALLHEPRLVIMDEVFSGLDPVNARQMRTIVGELRDAGTALIFSTHVLEHADQLCDDVVMLKDGEARIQGTVAEVKKRFGSDEYLVAPEDDQHRAAIREMPMVAKADQFPTHDRIRLHPQSSPSEFLSAMLAAGFVPRRFERVAPSLSDIFIEQIGGLRPDGSLAGE